MPTRRKTRGHASLCPPYATLPNPPVEMPSARTSLGRRSMVPAHETGWRNKDAVPSVDLRRRSRDGFGEPSRRQEGDRRLHGLYRGDEEGGGLGRRRTAAADQRRDHAARQERLDQGAERALRRN